MPTSIESNYVNITGYVSIPLTLIYEGVWTSGNNIREAPEWALVAGSTPCTLEEIGLGMLKVTPTEVGEIIIVATPEDSVEAHYHIHVKPAELAETFGGPKKIGGLIRCLQFGDLPELPPLPPMPPEE